MPRAVRSQSAMEYLATYGWAILIIVVIAAALVTLGYLGGGAALQTRAKPGTCQVSRPYGPYSITSIGLTGACTGGIPEYVVQFNGQSDSNVIVPYSDYMQSNSITVTGWGYVATRGTDGCNVEDIATNLASSNGGQGRTGFMLTFGWGDDVGFLIGNSISWSQLDVSNPSYNGK